MNTILVTGAAGSLGKILVDKLIKNGDHVRAMDINEAELASMNYPPEVFTKIYGDVSQYFRVYTAMRGCDKVYHLAAMKNLIITEFNSEDCIRINVKGTENVAAAAVDLKVKLSVFLSSDKACEACNLYGGTKLLGEQIWKAQARRQTHTIFTIVRSGNFFESRGNVFEYWEKLYKEGKPLPITDSDMERFFIDTSDLADILVDLPIDGVFNGGVVIPEMKQYNLLSLMLLKYGDETPFIIIGKRQGEKLKEKLKYDDEQTIYICNDYHVVK
jgi:UDP-N-acetylglucosamine 4,6-dehydratase